MSTAAQQRANKENAQHSTGPRTAEGKQRSSRNALKHGLCALDPLIPGEDPEAFEQHFCEIEFDLQPATAIESNLVEQIADVSWRLKRLSRIEAAVITAFYDAAAEQPLNQGNDTDQLLGKALAARGRIPRFQAARSIGLGRGTAAASRTFARSRPQTARSASHKRPEAAQDANGSPSTVAFALFLTSASPRGVPAPSLLLIATDKLNAPTWISSRFKMFSRPFKCNRRIRPSRNSARNCAPPARPATSSAACRGGL